jgi:uncharacterized membrane protein YbhN (UPF0104 family)
VKRHLRWVGSLVLVGVLVWRIDWRQVATAFGQLDVSYWLLALGVYLLTQGVSAARWQMLGRTLGLGGRWRDYLAHYFVGMFFNLVLPTSVGGDVVRAWYLGREGNTPHPNPPPQGGREKDKNPPPQGGREKDKNPPPQGGREKDKNPPPQGGREKENNPPRGERAKTNTPSPPVGEGWGGGAISRGTAAFLSVFADRVNGFAVLIAVACVATLCCPITLPEWIAWTVAGMGAACLGGLALLPALPWLREKLASQPRLVHLLDGAALFLRDRRGLVMVTLLSLVVQLANVVLAWLVGEGMGLKIPPLYYGVWIPLVSMLTLLPISLNGMGLRECGTVALLAPLGVDEATAFTLSLLVFAVYTAASLLGGVFYLFSRSPRFMGTEASDHADPVGGDSDQGRRGESPAAA